MQGSGARLSITILASRYRDTTPHASGTDASLFSVFSGGHASVSARVPMPRGTSEPSNPARSRSHTGRENWRALGRCLVLQRPPGHHLLVHGPLLRSQDGNSRSRLDRWRWLGVAILYAWTEADQALWAEVLNFWFLGRVFYR